MATKDLLIAVRDAREVEQKAKDHKALLLGATLIIEATEQHLNARIARDLAERALRERVLDAGEVEYGLREYGVKLKNRKGIPQYDTGDATDWCRDHFSAALIVDRKAFENFLKTAERAPEFVTISDDEPFVTIPTDLSGIE